MKLEDAIVWEIDKKVPSPNKEFPGSHILGTEVICRFEIIIGKHIATHSDEDIENTKEEIKKELVKTLIVL